MTRSGEQAMIWTVEAVFASVTQSLFSHSSATLETQDPVKIHSYTSPSGLVCRGIIRPLRWLFVTGTALLLSGCPQPSALEEVRAEGVLHVITRNTSSIYYEGREGPTGFEYELAHRFAEDLGVELRVRVAESNEEILQVLDQNYASIGMTGLSGAALASERFHTVPTRLKTQSVVIYNRDEPRPDKLDDLSQRTLHVVSGSNHLRHLESAMDQLEEPLSLRFHDDLDSVGILERVQAGDFPVAVIDANELALNHVFYPDVKRAFSLNEPENLAWLFPGAVDDSLAGAARTFLRKMERTGELEQIQERFYGHLDRLNYVGALTFSAHVRERLPQYEPVFRQYAAKNDLDWRLLAATGYQESNWRANAVSPTGVRGLMMLTQNTAEYVGIDNRLDPVKSIKGGAQYLRMVHGRVPESIPEPDRTWFALASYNVGFGHVQDARMLTEEAGRDPDRWIEVKEFLPLLAQKEWHSKTRFGYARGHEPVAYVQNIRRYYDVLVWMKDGEDSQQLAGTPPEEATDLVPAIPGPLPIRPGQQADESPALPRSLGMAPPTL